MEKENRRRFRKSQLQSSSLKAIIASVANMTVNAAINTLLVFSVKNTPGYIYILYLVSSRCPYLVNIRTALILVTDHHSYATDATP